MASWLENLLSQGDEPGALESLAVDLAQKRWNLTEWTRLSESGVFGSDRGVLLLDGEVLQMCPRGSAHATSLGLAQDLLQQILAPGTHLRIQLPLYLGSASDPEPDLAVVSGNRRDFAEAHPQSALLVLEISDSSLTFDLGKKMQIYARYGIPDYRVVDLSGRCLHHFSAPHQLGYSSAVRYGENQVVELNSASFKVSDLLP